MKNQIEAAKEVLLGGGVILYPTDTIWGLGCDPNNELALEKINKIKNRVKDKSFILLVNSEMLLNRYTKNIPEVCYDLIDFADKPLTIIYPEGQNVNSEILGKDGSLAIRKVNHQFCDKLINKMKSGIVSTSANISGKPYPKNFNEIDASIKAAVDLIIDSPNENKKSVPSQIIKIGLNSEVNIIRK